MPSGEASYIHLFIFPGAGTMWQCMKFMKPWMQPQHVAALLGKKTKKKSMSNYPPFWLFNYLITDFFFSSRFHTGKKCMLVSFKHLGKRTGSVYSLWCGCRCQKKGIYIYIYVHTCIYYIYFAFWLSFLSFFLCTIMGSRQKKKMLVSNDALFSSQRK